MPHGACLKEMTGEGYCGEIFQVHCAWHMGFFLDIYPGFSCTWFGKGGNGTSLTRNQGSHMLDLLRHLFDPVTSMVGRTFDRALEIQGIVEALYESQADRAWVDIEPVSPT